MKFRSFVPYRDRPLCFLDVETTGVKPGYHEVTEIGLRHEKMKSLCIQIAPQHMERAEYEALKVSRYKEEDWVDAKPFRFYADTISAYAENSTIVIHNAIFDVRMLQGEYDSANIEHDHLFRDVIDTMALARQFLVPHGLNLLSLKSCMRFIGEDYEGAHNAYADAVFVEKLYRYICNNVKWHGKINGKNIQEDIFGGKL